MNTRLEVILAKLGIILMTCLVAGCAAHGVKSKYSGLRAEEKKRHETEVKKALSEFEGKLVNLNSYPIAKETEQVIDNCGESAYCKKSAYANFIKLLRMTYDKVDFGDVLMQCHNTCETPKQLEYLTAQKHNVIIQKEMREFKDMEEQKHRNVLQNLDSEFQRELTLAQERDRQIAMAFAAGLSAYGAAMQQQAANLRSTSYSGYSYPTPYFYRPSYSRGVNTTSTSMDSGITFYSGDFSGTSQRIGSTTFYNVNPGLHGTAQQIGQFTYYNFNSGLRGTSQQIGNFAYHNFNSRTSGTTQSIGNFDYTNFSDGTHCTTQYIGLNAYTNCR